jgi:sec1 family domain-containing protein 1
MTVNMRSREVKLLERMLSLNSDGSSVEDFSDQWKVLVYDQDCRDIISPLLNVGALRAKGVTLHMLLHSDREPVPDAPAVYFIRPTETNIKRIIDDCKNKLYRAVYLNFLTRIERSLLENLAKELVANGTVGTIVSVTDQYLDTISLEPSLFSLNMKNSFISLNAKGVTENDMKTYMSRVASGLLSSIRVIGSVPIIRAPSGGAAEMLARDLGSLLRENLDPRGAAHSLFTEAISASQHQNRPLFLIFDRSTDMAPPLQHTSTYQALVDDLLDHRLNRVTVDISGSKTSGSSSSESKKRTYDLNTQSDAFYSLYAGEPFPEAVEANERELAEVSQRESDIRSRPQAGLGDVPKISSTDGGADLTSAIESLPEILAKKANLEAHTNVLQAVMARIAAREVPTFFEIEQTIIVSGNIADKNAILDLLRDGTKGDLSDKTRLLLVIALAGGDHSSKSLWDPYETAFVQGCAVMSTPPSKDNVDKMINAINFTRKLQSLQRPLGGSKSGNSSYGAIGSQDSTGLSSLLNAAGKGALAAMAKAQSFFTKFSPLYVSQIVDSLSEGRTSSDTEHFITIDPRAKATDLVDVRGTKYADVYVFVVGGGCYSEFYNLQELKKLSIEAGNTLRSVGYGSTEILSADSFLEQLQSLGST